MKKIDPAKPPKPLAPDAGANDLASRLARYRRRIEAEGRPRSLRLIDQAIADADKKERDKRK